MKGNVDDSEAFIEQYKSKLHPNHYHMVNNTGAML